MTFESEERYRPFEELTELVETPIKKVKKGKRASSAKKSGEPDLEKKMKK